MLSTDQEQVRAELENELVQLRQQKATLAEATYYERLEQTLVKLAQLYEEVDNQQEKRGQVALTRDLQISDVPADSETLVFIRRISEFLELRLASLRVVMIGALLAAVICGLQPGELLAQTQNSGVLLYDPVPMDSADPYAIQPNGYFTPVQPLAPIRNGFRLISNRYPTRTNVLSR